MSFFYSFEDYTSNYTHDNHTPYVVNPNTLSCETEPLTATPAIILCLILIAIFLLAIPGNLLVGWVIGTSRQARTPSDIYLFHLTIADGLMALTIPFWAIALLKGWIFGDFLCKFLSLTFETNFYTSVLFLACISIDRYLVIVHASENVGTRQRKCSRILCGAVWAFGLALALPALFNDAFKLTTNSERIICHERFDIDSASSWRNVTHGFRHIFGFFLPLFVMIMCYSITITKLLQSRGFRKHRAMKVIIAVVVVFLLCWTPYHMTTIIDLLMKTGLIRYDCALRMSVDRAMVITNGLALFHSCINPVLYAFVGEKFRMKMMQLFHWKTRADWVSKISRSTSQTSEGNGAVL
ncbi:hypothetical protein PBY51_016866 [Eleginops maclovinus]|uniref:G-protein coupled receptors family 1 profile domain-containing protein n=1 Tax=Eleginops maclovinus TaxID=56733 RepID=A0AAN7WR55_ELEMC|nr:hypothetical protein PBY51_016866 [Eleginops maclovinus]